MNVKDGSRSAVLSRCVGTNATRHSTRRTFLIAGAAWAIVGRIGQASAQSKQGPILIGLLHFGSREAGAASLAAFKEGLAALGWKEGAQLVIDARWAEGRNDRLDALAAELAAKKPAIIIASSLRISAVLTKAAPKTPIVQAGGADPVTDGLAASHARPGGMLTGMTNITGELGGKFFELLLAAAPKLRRVGILLDRGAVNFSSQSKALQRSAAHHSLDARIAEVAKPEDIELALADLAKHGAQALVVTASPMLSFERRRIVKLALTHRWPVVAGTSLWADAGALLSYGADLSHAYRRAAYYVDRILKGAAPGDLPIEQPTKFDLVVNLKTAKALGITIPQSVMLQATRVIE